MCQKTDFIFQTLLKKAREKRLNIEDIYTLNRKVATKLPIFRLLDNNVVVHKKKLRHLINRLKIE